MDSFLNNTNYRFTTKSIQDDLLYNPPIRQFKYYQICSFKNPWTGKYHIRRLIMNSKNEFVNIEELYIDKRQYQRFVKTHRLNEYKLYNTYDLNHVSLPTMGEITIVQSPILENDNGMGGYAKF